MSKETKMAIAYIGIGLTIVYFLAVAGYFLTESSLMSGCWEAMIILSGPIMLVVLISILENADENKKGFKTAAIAFMTCTTAITTAAHYANVVSPDKTIMEFQLDDTLAWGFFMGLAFIFTSIALSSEIPKLKRVKYTTMVSGCLCLMGLFGPIFDIAPLWLIAVVGYGIGTPIICMQLISFYKKPDLN